MKEQEYKHAEAFNIMNYRCEACGNVEKLWNSRDGVTPFMIGCPKCNGTSQHVDWNADVKDPNFKPPKGMRVFVDLTKEKSLEYNLKRSREQWGSEAFAHLRERYKTPEALAQHSTDGMREGEPDIIEWEE